MAIKYTRISIDIEFDEIADSISTIDLISEINSRKLDVEEQSHLRTVAFEKLSAREFTNLKLNCIQEMKMEWFLQVMDKYTIEEIETLLTK